MTLCSSTSKPPRKITTQTRLLSPVTLVNPRLASTTSPASMEADASSPSACLPSMQGSRPYEKTASLLHVPAESPSVLWRGAPCLQVQSWSGSAWSSDSRTEPTSTVSTPPIDTSGHYPSEADSFMQRPPKEGKESSSEASFMDEELQFILENFEFSQELADDVRVYSLTHSFCQTTFRTGGSSSFWSSSSSLPLSTSRL